MDELLRAYAKKRREQAEPALEMHPATRKLLQDEVKRTCGATPAPAPKQSRSSWFSARWPLGALGGALAVLLLMFTVFHTPAPKPSPATLKEEGIGKKEENSDLLTRNPFAAPAPTERNLSEAKPMLRAPEPLAESKSAARDAQPGDLDSHAAQENGSAVVSTAPAGVPLAANSVAAAPLAEGTAAPAPLVSSVASTTSTPLLPPTSVTPQTAAAPAPAIAGNIAPAAALPPVRSFARDARQGGLYGGALHQNVSAAGSPAPASVPAAVNDGSVVVAGEFVQVHDRARGRATESLPSSVLSMFHFSRAGQNVRVVDADGSVYDGQVLGEIPVAAATEQFARKPKDANQNANYAFKVAGTNHNLQQNIIFTGNVLAMPVAAPAGQVAAQNQNRNASQAQNAQSNGLAQTAQNSRITGKVQVGGGKEFKIEAKPPPP